MYFNQLEKEKMINGLISIIVPVYNVEPYLKRCVESILGQTYTNLELLLIDDGSTDGSEELCDYYRKIDTRVRVFHKNNGGVSAARNVGLLECRGEYIAFVDADDWVELIMYQKMIELLEDSNADFAVCNEKRIYSVNNTAVSNHWPGMRNPEVLEGGDIYKKVLSCSAVIWNKVFKSYLLEGLEFNTSMHYGEDCVFLIDVIKRANKAIIIPEVLYNYYIGRPGNILSSGLNENDLEFLDNTSIVYNCLENLGYPELGIHRINISIGEVISKSYNKLSRGEYYLHSSACKNLAKKPLKRSIYAYLKDTDYPIRDKMIFLTCRINPQIYIFLKEVKKYVRTHYS